MKLYYLPKAVQGPVSYRRNKKTSSVKTKSFFAITSKRAIMKHKSNIVYENSMYKERCLIDSFEKSEKEF